MSVVTGSVKFTKSGQGFPSRYKENVMRFNVLVALDKPLPDGTTEQRAYFDEGEQPYEGLQKGDRVYVMNAGTYKAKLALIDEDAAAPVQLKQAQTEVPNKQYQQQQHKQQNKPRNRYDVVDTTVDECAKYVRGASAVMLQCILEARTVRETIYADSQLTAIERAEYDRALAVTLFIKATEGKQPVGSELKTTVVESVEEDEDDTLF